MSVKYGMLTILEEQLMVSSGKSRFKIRTSMTVHLFNRTIKNILHNFIPHEVITCDDRDPPWINSSIKRLIQAKNEAYKRFKRSNNNSQYFEKFSIHSEFTWGFY